MATILVVDDNYVLRSIMARRLKRVGWEVVLASNGEEALEIAQSNMPDLILMDMTMPVMDGWTATRLLRENPLTRHIPILAFTAQPMSSRDEDAIAVGCDGHIAKPFEFSAVIEKIRTFLNEPPTSRPANSPRPSQ